jgi:hypothetical protein
MRGRQLVAATLVLILEDARYGNFVGRVFLAIAAWLDELHYRATAGMAITEELHVVKEIVKALEDVLEEPPDSLSGRSPRPSFH